MTHTGELLRLAQLTDGLHQVVAALMYFNIKVDAIVLHDIGDTKKLGDAFSRAMDMVPRTDGKTDTKLNGVQFIDRFEA